MSLNRIGSLLITNLYLESRHWNSNFGPENIICTREKFEFIILEEKFRVWTYLKWPVEQLRNWIADWNAWLVFQIVFSNNSRWTFHIPCIMRIRDKSGHPSGIFSLKLEYWIAEYLVRHFVCKEYSYSSPDLRQSRPPDIN